MRKNLTFTFSFILILLISSCKVGRFIIYNFADLDDFKKFPNRTIDKGTTTFQFYTAVKERVPKSIAIKDQE